jgi:hypothetical protein
VMAATYEPISSQTLGSAASSVEFTSLPGTYTDLVVVCRIGTTGGSQNIQVQVNSDTGSNYSYTFLAGDGSAAHSGRYSNQTQYVADNYAYANTGLESVYIYQVMSYANTNVYKTFLGSAATTGRAITKTVGLWRSTSAITAIKLFPSGAETFKADCVFSVYGIKASA